MGLNFRGAAAAWSYSGFMEFRDRLAASIGIELWAMEGFHGYEHARRKVEGPAKPWPADEPLTLLINHSDTDGELSAEDCAKIAPRLREVVASWSYDDFASGYDKDQALLLADGMEMCARDGVPLVFT